MQVSTFRGAASAFHAMDVPVPGVPATPVEAHVWWFEVDRPALVLGSSQPLEMVDIDACSAAGVEVVRRRSGGGAVLLVPDEVIWFDVLIHRSDPRWNDDVGESALWLGRAIASALQNPDLTVHAGPMVTTRWSSLVCFAGLGAGEVLLDGRKVAGISQRRTRSAARFQVALYRRWDPSALVRLLAPPAPTAPELEHLVAAADLQLPALSAALTRES